MKPANYAVVAPFGTVLLVCATLKEALWECAKANSLPSGKTYSRVHIKALKAGE